MVLAQVRPCAVSVMAGNNRCISTSADSSPHCSKTLGDDHHAGRMGVRTEDDKRPRASVGWPGFSCSPLSRERPRPGIL